MILTEEILYAIKPGDKIRYWGSFRPVAKIGDVRNLAYTGIPWRMVELSNPTGGTTMFSIEAGDNGPACGGVEFA